MGSALGSIVEKRNRELKTMGGSVAVVDGYIQLHQFLNSIRDHETGEYLKNENGDVTSHLVGWFYRFGSVIDAGIRPVVIFDGGYPDLKQDEVDSRQESRQKAQQKFEEAKEEGDTEKMKKYAAQRISVDEDIVESTKELLDAMGIPTYIAPSEADPQCVQLMKEGVADYSITQDYDHLLYGADYILQNFNKDSGDVISLQETLENNELSHEELVWYGILLGTDYNSSPHGVGPKRAMNIINGSDDFGDVISGAQSYDDIDVDTWWEVHDWFESPDVDEGLDPTWEKPDTELLRDMLINKYEFSENRVNSKLEGIDSTLGTTTFDDF